MLKKILLYVILLSLTVGILYGINEVIPRTDTGLTEKIARLQNVADSLQNANSQLDSLVNSYNSQLVQYRGELQVKDSKINQLKTDVEKSVNAVDTVSYYELVKFFTNRYDSSLITGPDSTSSH